MGIPFSGWDLQSEVNVAGRPPVRASQAIISHFQQVFPTYFKAMGIPLLRGRMLASTDRDSSARVGVVNETFVRSVFPHEEPLGKRIKLGDTNSRDPWVTIVGVIRDFRHYKLPQPMGPAIYMPYALSTPSTQTLVVRTSVPDPYSLVPAIRAAIHELDA